MQSYIVGNWKMNGDTGFIDELVDTILSKVAETSAELVLCPPSVFLQAVLAKTASTSVKLGAQNVCAEAVDKGAYTGEVSAHMLDNIGCNYAIVGHSERRAYYGESNSVIANKVQNLLKVDVTPIVCVGESLEERESNTTFDVIETQLRAVLDKVLQKNPAAELLIAYEPIWAIGTGLSASPEEAQAVHAFIREILQAYDINWAATVPILYGGSVKPDSAKKLLAQKDINGALVGGASLKGEDFINIAKTV